MDISTSCRPTKDYRLLILSIVYATYHSTSRSATRGAGSLCAESGEHYELRLHPHLLNPFY